MKIDNLNLFSDCLQIKNILYSILHATYSLDILENSTYLDIPDTFNKFSWSPSSYENLIYMIAECFRVLKIKFNQITIPFSPKMSSPSFGTVHKVCTRTPGVWVGLKNFVWFCTPGGGARQVRTKGFLSYFGRPPGRK